MSINNEKQDNLDYIFIVGVSLLIFVVYVYFLYSGRVFKTLCQPSSLIG